MSPRLRNLILAGGVCIAMAIAAAVTLLLRPGLIARTEPTTEIRTGDERTLFRKAPLPGPGEEPAIEPLAYPGGDYKFQEHMGPFPFDYEPPIPAHRMTELLADALRVGEYPSDDPSTLQAEDREPEAEPRSLGWIGWHKEQADYGEILGAIRDELLPALARPDGAWRGALSTAVGAATRHDAAGARFLAQMQLRLSPPDPKKLGNAVDALAETLFRAGRDARLRTLLDQKQGFRPTEVSDLGAPPGLDRLLSPERLDEKAGPLLRFRLAVARGDRTAAERHLERIPEKKRPEHADIYLARLAEGLGARLGEKGREKLAGHFETLDGLFEGFAQPTQARFDGWSPERALEWVRWCEATAGGVADPGADALLYLLEQRDFDGGDLLPHIPFAAARRVDGRPFGDYGRSIPLYVLAQTVSFPPWPPGRAEAGEKAMLRFNGFESSIYAAMALSTVWGGDLDESHPVRERIGEAILKMLDYSQRLCQSGQAASISGRPGYLLILVRERWVLRRRLYGAEAVIPDLKRVIERSPTRRYRRWARWELGICYELLDRPRAAYELWREQALGHDGVAHMARGVRRMADAGARVGEPKLIKQAIALGRRARAALEAGRVQGREPKTRRRERDELKKQIAYAKRLADRLASQRNGTDDPKEPDDAS